MTGEQGRRLARRVIGGLKRQYGSRRVSVRRPALDELLLGILSEGTSERKAAEASLRAARALGEESGMKPLMARSAALLEALARS